MKKPSFGGFLFILHHIEICPWRQQGAKPRRGLPASFDNGWLTRKIDERWRFMISRSDTGGVAPLLSYGDASEAILPACAASLA